MNKKLSSRKAARKVHSKTMKRKNLSKKMKKMKKTKKVRFSRKKKIRGGAAANTGGIGSNALHSGPLKNKGAALLYLMLNPSTMKNVMNTTEKKDLSHNERRLKMVNDILQYVEHETQLRTYIEQRRALTKGQADTIRKVLELMLDNITTHYNHNNFADTYYYDEVLHLTGPNLQPGAQDAIRIQFQTYLTEEIEKVLYEDLNKGNIDETLFKLSGLNDQIFKNITDRMKQFIVVGAESQISLEDINLLESYKAKEYFYELLKETIQSYKTDQKNEDIMNQFRDALKIFQDKRKMMYDNIYQKFDYFLRVTQDHVFVTTKVQEKIRQFNYYVTDIQNEAHRRLIEFYSSGQGSLLLSIRDSLIKRGLTIIEGIKLSAQKTLTRARGSVVEASKGAAETVYNNAMPHILYGLTDRIIFDSFTKQADLSKEPFMSPEKLERFEAYRDSLEKEIYEEKTKQHKRKASSSNDIKLRFGKVQMIQQDSGEQYSASQPY